MNKILDGKKHNLRNESSFRIEVTLSKPTSKGYTLVDFAPDCQRDDTDESTGNEANSSSGDSYDCDEKGRKREFIASDLMAKGIGYNTKDAFIDDSEVVVPVPISKMKQTFFGGYFLNIGEARIKGGIVSEIKFEPDLLGDPLMSQEPCLDTIRPSERVFPGMEILTRPTRMTGQPPLRRLVGQPPNKRLKPNPGITFYTDSSDDSDTNNNLPSPPKTDQSMEPKSLNHSTDVPLTKLKTPVKKSPKKSPLRPKSQTPQKSVKKLTKRKLSSHLNQSKKHGPGRPKKNIETTPVKDQPTTSGTTDKQSAKIDAAPHQSTTSASTKHVDQLEMADLLTEIQNLEDKSQLFDLLRKRLSSEQFSAFIKSSQQSLSTKGADVVKKPETSKQQNGIQTANGSSARSPTKTGQQSSPSKTPHSNVTESSSTAQSSLFAPSQSFPTNSLSVQSTNAVASDPNALQPPKKPRPYKKKLVENSSGVQSSSALNLSVPTSLSGTSLSGQLSSSATLNPNLSQQPKKPRPYKKKSIEKPSTTNAQSLNVFGLPIQSSLQVAGTSPSGQSSNQPSSSTSAPSLVQQPKKPRPYKKKMIANDAQSLNTSGLSTPTSLQAAVCSLPAQSAIQSSPNTSASSLVQEPKKPRPYKKKTVANDAQSTKVAGLPAISTSPSVLPTTQSTIQSSSNTSAPNPSQPRPYTKKIDKKPDETPKPAVSPQALANAQQTFLSKYVTKMPDGNFTLMGKTVDSAALMKFMNQFQQSLNLQTPKPSSSNVASTPKTSVTKVKPTTNQQKPNKSATLPQKSTASTANQAQTNNTVPSTQMPTVPSALSSVQKPTVSKPPEVPKPPKKLAEKPSSNFTMNQLIESAMSANLNNSQSGNNPTTFNAAMLASMMAAKNQLKNSITSTTSGASSSKSQVSPSMPKLTPINQVAPEIQSSAVQKEVQRNPTAVNQIQHSSTIPKQIQQSPAVQKQAQQSPAVPKQAQQSPTIRNQTQQSLVAQVHQTLPTYGQMHQTLPTQAQPKPRKPKEPKLAQPTQPNQMNPSVQQSSNVPVSSTFTPHQKLPTPTQNVQQSFKTPLTSHSMPTPPPYSTAKTYPSNNPPYQPVHPSQYLPKNLSAFPQSSSTSNAFSGWPNTAQSSQYTANWYNPSQTYPTFSPHKSQQPTNSTNQPPITPQMQRSHHPPTDLNSYNSTKPAPPSFPSASNMSSTNQQQMTVRQAIEQARQQNGSLDNFSPELRQYFAAQQTMSGYYPNSNGTNPK